MSRQALALVLVEGPENLTEQTVKLKELLEYNLQTVRAMVKSRHRKNVFA